MDKKNRMATRVRSSLLYYNLKCVERKFAVYCRDRYIFANRDSFLYRNMLTIRSTYSVVEEYNTVYEKKWWLSPKSVSEIVPHENVPDVNESHTKVSVTLNIFNFVWEISEFSTLCAITRRTSDKEKRSRIIFFCNSSDSSFAYWSKRLMFLLWFGLTDKVV